jgi:hypothetical protein
MAHTRKPPIYLAVSLPIYLLGAWTVVALLLKAYQRTSGVAPNAIPNRNGLLIVLPALFLWMPVSLLLSNVMLRVVAPLRSIAEQYAKRSGHSGFRESQRFLLRAAVLVGLVCSLLIALGFWL